MLSELNTLTLFRLDTCTIWFVIWIYCKHWEYLIFLLSNFTSLIIKTTETTVLKIKNKIAMSLFRMFILSPDYLGNFSELGFRSKYNWQHSSQKDTLRIEGAAISSGNLHTFGCETNTGSCRKVYVHNCWCDDFRVVSTQLDVQCVVRDGSATGALKDQDLAWRRWHKHNSLRILCAPSVHFLINANT